MVDIVDIALCICRLLLYNNFKRGVMSQVNVCVAFRMSLYFRNLIASYDRRLSKWRYINIWIVGFSLQGAVLNMIYSVFNVVKYNSNDVL